MTKQTDVVVIGAGPAGLAAAETAAAHGLEVTLIDEQPSAGGQIYRAVAHGNDALDDILGGDYVAGRKLLDTLADPRVHHIAGATVWDMTRERDVYYSKDGEAQVLNARYVIIATGAMERPTPFSGWTLPGVMTAGAGQILLKTSGVLPPQPIVLAGSGPLLLLLATQYLRAGQSLAAIVETTRPSNRFNALKHTAGMLGASDYIKKGLRMLTDIRRQHVPIYKGARKLRAAGSGELERVSFEHRGATRSLECRTLMVHAGVVPSVQLTQLLGVEHHFDPRQRCWHPVVDDNGETGIQGIAVAGDGASIAGAEAAHIRGVRSGLAAARALEKIDDAQLASNTAPLSRKLRGYVNARPFLDALYPPAEEFLDPPDDVMVCRCEEIRAGTIREYVDLGCLGPNQTKAFGRSGMGPCQGRMCGATVSEIIARRRGASMEDVGTYRVRAPIKPVTVGEMASMSEKARNR